MHPKGYLIFHLNLAFSSIEKEARPAVIKKCYHRLLDLIERTGVPIGIELTGWTLKQIADLDSNWIKRFKSLLEMDACELIGSGYCQLIGPLVPQKVNQWNQKLGLLEYERILGIRPVIALVNEMAYSSSLIDLYHQSGYRGIIIDRDNVRLALELDKYHNKIMPAYGLGAGGASLPVLWSDSILFQKVQHYAHGDTTLGDYIDYIRQRSIDGDSLLPIYCNDAEVFDYRPGRFAEERATHKDGEWNRIQKLLSRLSKEIGVEWIKPTDALFLNVKGSTKMASSLTSAKHPIAVKKQAKYNIARWAVTGRNDLFLNTMCYRIEAHLNKTNNDNFADWRGLCELWASDLRTHITESRWRDATHQLDLSLSRYKISSILDNPTPKSVGQYLELSQVIGSHTGALIEVDDSILVSLTTSTTRIVLNLRRGLCIHALSFASHGLIPSVGTIPHGYFSSIALGADFYSGGTVIELPLERRRVTDLEAISPSFLVGKNGDIAIKAEISTPLGIIVKTVTVSPKSESVTLGYDFPNWNAFVGSVRLGIITLVGGFVDNGTRILCKNGGETLESFILDGDINHAIPASSLVSSCGGFGATSGEMAIENKKQHLYLRWNPKESAVMPMLQHTPSVPNGLSRIFFSMSEIDDTNKSPSLPISFSLNISTESFDR